MWAVGAGVGVRCSGLSAQGWLGTHRRVLEVHVRFHRRRELDHLGHTVRDDAEHEENADLRDLHTT